MKIITIGKCKEAWLASALSEYIKRLQGKMSIEWVLAKDDHQLSQLAQQEPFIALHPEGTLLTSEILSKKVISWGMRLNFVIGGAEGIEKDLLDKAQFCWSLSPLTFTHQITRLILVEQLYRATEIERGSRYHK